MAKKKQTPVETPAPTPIVGHVIKPRYREFTCDWFDLDEGEVPFTATIRSNLPFDQVNALPAISTLTYAQTWELMAPHIKAWNLMAYCHETGELEPVPPPMEAGPEAFKATDPAYSQWCYMTLCLAHQGGLNGVVERKNDLGPSEGGPEPENSAD